MATMIDREQFLHCLESVRPGVASREGIEQGLCICFKDGEAFTFNEEMSCRAKTGLDKDCQGAVKAEKLLKILSMMGDTEISISFRESELFVKGSGSRTAFTLEKEITLPIEEIEVPDKWSKLDPLFSEAVRIVVACTGGEKANFKWKCVHIHPQWIEACDGNQVCRWKLDTGIGEELLVRNTSIRNIITMGAEEFAVTPRWIHFRRGKGKSEVRLSCRIYKDAYRDMGPILKVTGVKTKLPEGLELAAAMAEIFSSENYDANLVIIGLVEGKLVLRGEGTSGRHKGTYRSEWSGNDFDFLISPILFKDIIKKNTEVEISKEPPRLIIRSGKMQYLSCLGKPAKDHDE